MAQGLTAVGLVLALVASCATMQGEPMQTDADKTKRGAGIGAAAGAVLGAVLGEGDADEILAGAALGAGIGAGVGRYMDRQEEQLARIPGTTVERIGKDKLLVNFDADILFAVDSAKLDDAAYRKLDELAGVLADFPKTAVVVQGHTDSTGREEYNQRLSERRAKAVMNELIGQGVDSGRITAIGYGETHPVASNQTERGRAQNRRVNLLLKAKVR
jgi:outer membrane protein OmpA-like peptidoglycan-associated protein